MVEGMLARLPLSQHRQSRTMASNNISSVPGGLKVRHVAQVATSKSSKVRKSQVARAEESKEGGSASPVEEVAGTEKVTEKKSAGIERGQATAIITGAISVLLGVGYLVLVQLLDTRGVTLIPPPPEAFGQ